MRYSFVVKKMLSNRVDNLSQVSHASDCETTSCGIELGERWVIVCREVSRESINCEGCLLNIKKQ